MAELLERIGDLQTVALLKERSAEYKKIVNQVGWDGKWYAYAFIDDEPIGGHACHEGKIYLNPQTWAILAGIYDTPKKLEQMYLAVHTYLSSVHGPHLMFPPYTKYGQKCGRIARHRPGTFSNGAIYLHGASFKVVADCACGKYDEALDTLSRILPNNEDGCDTRRTSEPYAVGNVYYGVTHPCHGLNLYTWFTATPAWLIHGGFEGLLGVKAEYDGLKIEARDIDGWDSYKVEKLYRGTRYTIEFSRGEEKGVFVDGQKKDGLVRSQKKECLVSVVY
jgi:cellobiose phosphorylase